MGSFLVSRFGAFFALGCVFLLIYQVVFMTRTSAARDWNHLHNSHFTLQDLQRFSLVNIDRNSIEQNLVLPVFPQYFKSSGTENILTIHKINGRTPPSLADLFAVPIMNFGEKVTFNRKELYVQKGLWTSIDHLVDSAQRSGANAVYLQVPSGWVPNIGLQTPKLPIILANIPPADRLELSLTTLMSSTYEWTLHGYSADTIIVGDSRGTPQSTAMFLEIARVFHELYKQGWKPYRSVLFVSFAHYSASQWADSHKSWLDKRGIAYVDCGSLPQEQSQIFEDRNRTVSSSPLLGNLARFAEHHLVGADLLCPLNFTPTSCSLGGNTFAFDHQIPTLSTAFTDWETASRFLSLVSTTLVQSPILPFKLGGYTPFFNSTEFNNTAVQYDVALEHLIQSFTQEFPWYQFGNKLRALVNRKLVNLELESFEHLLKVDGHHAIFSSNNAYTKTVVHSVNPELVEKALRSLSFQLRMT